MTTTIYDGLQRVVGSDSRWSCFAKEVKGSFSLCPQQEATHIVYVDDTGFGKILLRQDIVLCLAGNGGLIEQWKRWWRANTLVKNYPPFTTATGDYVALYAVDLKTNEMYPLSNQIDCSYVDPNTRQVRALFSGSGGEIAFRAWRATMNVIASIKFAISFDCCSGGGVRYIDYAAQQQDIEDSFHTMLDVRDKLITGGFVMELNIKNAIPITDAQFDGLRHDLSGQTASIGAPLGPTTQVIWDESAFARLDALVDLVSAREADAEI